jgi:hypothetical protein
VLLNKSRMDVTSVNASIAQRWREDNPRRIN